MAEAITELFTWVESDPVGGEGVIAVVSPLSDKMMTLVTRNRWIAEGPFRVLASEHHRVSGHTVRLIRWSQPEELEVFLARSDA